MEKVNWNHCSPSLPKQELRGIIQNKQETGSNEIQGGTFCSQHIAEVRDSLPECWGCQKRTWDPKVIITPISRIKNTLRGPKYEDTILTQEFPQSQITGSEESIFIFHCCTLALL